MEGAHATRGDEEGARLFFWKVPARQHQYMVAGAGQVRVVHQRRAFLARSSFPGSLPQALASESFTHERLVEEDARRKAAGRTKGVAGRFE